MNTLLAQQLNDISPGLVIGIGLLLVIIAAVVIIAKLMVVGNPSEMLIISGKRQKDGQGYRTLIGGRTLVIPIIEKVSRLSLRNPQFFPETPPGPTGFRVLVPDLFLRF